MMPSVPNQSSPLTRLLASLLSALIPPLLLLLSVRLVLTPLYVTTLYQMPFFPEDRFGWAESVRQEYGPYGVRYLLNDAGIEYLGDLQIEGQAAFNERELKHMEDVKVVTRAALTVLNVCLLLAGLCSLGLLARRKNRSAWVGAVGRGGLTTLAVSLSLLVVALLSWDFFFDSFHALFFADGTWQFYTSDTLIRLYPQTFWFTSALVVGVLTIGGALICVLGAFWYRRRAILGQA
jgi:integral membrane protein (TIGR01906 family)